MALSQKVFLFASNLTKKLPNHFHVDSVQDSDLAPFLRDWSQSETLSEIKSPLDTYATKQDFEILFSIAIS